MGRAKWLIAAILTLAMLLPVVLVGGMLFFANPPAVEDDCFLETSGNIVNTASVPFSKEGLFVNGKPMEEDSAQIVVEAYDIATARAGEFTGERLRTGMLAILEAGNVESGIHNLDYGDSDSLGWLQQRPSVKVWGTADQIMVTSHATNKFFDALVTVPNWWEMAPHEAAQAVQRSGFPDRYAEREAESIAIYDRLSGTTACGPSSPTDLMHQQVVQAALTQLNQPYQWGSPADGAGFVSWAFEQAQVRVPNSLDDLFAFRGSEELGTTTTFYPAADFASGTVEASPADILFWSDNGTDKPTRAALALNSSSDAETSVNVATWNLHVGPGYQQRAQRAAELIQARSLDVVGFQEIEHIQSYLALKQALAGVGYKLYPELGPGDIIRRNSEGARPIAYKSPKYELLPGSTSFEYLRMADPLQPAKAPIITLRDTTTDRDLVVANTHNPAYGQNPPEKAGDFNGPHQRALAAEEYAKKLAPFVQQGLPVIFPGDFNESHSVYGSQGTWENKAENLATCRLLAVGIVDAEDTFSNKGGFCDGTNNTNGGPIDHIFVSSDIRVEDFYIISGTLSDHDARAARLTIPGVVTTPQSDDSYGAYIGLKPGSGTIAVLPIMKKGFLGAIRVSMSSTQIPVEGDWTLPVQKPYALSAFFGQCGEHWADCHTGQDFAVPKGTPVYAVTNGNIIYANSGEDAWAGNHIVLQIAGGYTIWYCHLNGFALRSGAVEAGTLIGYVGATGNAFGYHLHFEVRTPAGVAIDPMEVLRENGLDP